jgi:hypothetical protein
MRCLPMADDDLNDDVMNDIIICLCAKAASGPFRWRNVSTAQSRLLPSISGALIRQFADRPLKGAQELHAIRFREPYVSVPIQRDAPELPYETSSVG